MEYDFLSQPRQVSLEWHLKQVMNWLRFDDGRKLDNVLVYASFELRAAIERYVFELYCIVKKNNISKEELSKCSKIGGTFSLIQANHGCLEKAIEFTQIVASMAPGAPKLTFVDFPYLKKKWQELSTFCHKQFMPSESFDSRDRVFQERGFALISEVMGKLTDKNWESNRGLIDPETMPEEVRDVYNKYVGNTIDAAQVRRMLDLMEPILLRRKALLKPGRKGT